MGDLVLVDRLPVARGGRVHGRGLEHGRGHPVCERAVHDVGVPGDPADVRHAREAVVGVHVEHVLDRQRGAEQVAAGGVDDTLGLASGARGLWVRG